MGAWFRSGWSSVQWWGPREGAWAMPTRMEWVLPASRERRVPTKAPEVGQHTDEVMRSVLGWSDAQIAEVRAAGGFG